MRIDAARTLEGDRVEQTARGWSSVSRYVVVEAAGESLYDATRLDGIPRLGQAHPQIPGIQVINKSAERIAGDSAVAVTVEYGVPDPDDTGDGAGIEGQGEIEIDAALISEQTYRDIRGAIMRVSYDGRPYLFTIDGEEQSVGRVRLTKVITANVERPNVSLRFTRVERDISIAQIAALTGKINRSPFLGFPAGTWLCRRINPRAIAGGRYRTTYELIYDPRGWRLEGAVDYAGLVPFDATPGNGIEFFDIYEQADFSPLRIGV